MFDNHINIHHDRFWISVKHILIYCLENIQYDANDCSYIAYNYTTLVTRQSDVLVVKKKLIKNSIDSSNGCPLHHA